MTPKQLKFLKRHKYLVQIQDLPNGCFVLTPERNIDYFVPESLTSYIIVDKEQSGIIVSSTEFDETFVAIPKYALTAALAIEIHNSCKNLQYSEDLINFIDDNGQQIEKIDFNKKITLEEHDKQKKLELEQIFLDQVRTGFKNNVQKQLNLAGVSEGYKILESLYRSEVDESSSIDR